MNRTKAAMIGMALVLALAGMGAASPHGTEVRVYIADKDKKLVDPADVGGVTIKLDRPGSKPLETELSTPSKGDKRFGIGHGGEVVESGGYFVEVVIYNPHDPSGRGARAEDDGTPFFRAEVDTRAYPEFQAVVIFKIKGETRNAKGFEYPPAVPATLKDAVAKLEATVAKLEELVKAKDHDATHGLEKRVYKLCDGIPGLAPADSKAEVEKSCKELAALFKDLDKAVHSGDADAVTGVMGKYKAAVAGLRKQVK
jgi:hypothetical protein